MSDRSPIRSTVAERIAAVAADRVHGASFLAREALSVMALAAAESDAASVAALRSELSAVAAGLAAAKPDMAPVRYWLSRLIEQLQSATTEDVATLRRRAIDEAAHLRRQSEEAGTVAAHRAAALLPDVAVVATASFSQTVVDALTAANRSGRDVRVIALRSVANGVAYGERMVTALVATGVPATAVADDAVPFVVEQATLGLIGADTVLADGSVVNGTPSRRLAEALAAAGKPLFVVCETAKIDRERSSTSNLHPAPGFDLVPAGLVAWIVTEVGVLN